MSEIANEVILQNNSIFLIYTNYLLIHPILSVTVEPEIFLFLPAS